MHASPIRSPAVPPPMVDQLSRARAAVQRASDEVDDATLRNHLDSLDEGLMEQTEAAKTESDEPDGDQLEQIETELVRVMDETGGAALEHLEEARDAIDAYRRAYTRDWDAED